MQVQLKDDPVCNSAGYCGDMGNHNGYNVRPEAFDMDNMAHHKDHKSTNKLAQIDSDPICSSLGCPKWS